MKLYLTLDNEKGNKIEKTVIINDSMIGNGFYGEFVESMIDSMEKVEKENQEEELVTEAERITQHTD